MVSGRTLTAGLTALARLAALAAGATLVVPAWLEPARPPLSTPPSSSSSPQAATRDAPSSAINGQVLILMSLVMPVRRAVHVPTPAPPAIRKGTADDERRAT